MQRTVLAEHFHVEGRRPWFETIDEMQAVLDRWLVRYNAKRPHQSRNMNGRTPMNTSLMVPVCTDVPWASASYASESRRAPWST